ncbi:MAG: protein kinase domain-containing protein [Bradymonadia bacterium]
MKTCPSCQALCEPEARFCLECGEALDMGPIADPQDDPWQGRVVAGRFQIIEKLGDGGMGEVFLAEQTTMERRVALKVLRQELCADPQQVERFKREAQAASRLSHPNTIIVHDFGLDEGGVLFIAMEFLEGQTLDQVLASVGALDPERAVRILVQVCASLEEAHAQGVIHRDLKPENIFLTRRGQTDDFVKVLDFGIAKVQRNAQGGQMSKLTRTGAIFGTPQYMSPEQIRGEDLDARSDVYAMGVILYEVLSGHLPFKANSAVEMLTKHLSEKPPPIEQPGADQEIIAHLQAISMRALSKDPSQRHTSVRAFMEDLMAAIPSFSLPTMTGMAPATAGIAPATIPVEVVLPAPGADERKRAPMMVALLALLVAGGSAAWYMTQGSGGGGGGGFDAGRAAPAALYQDGEGEVDPAKAEADAKKAEEEAKKVEAEAAKAKAEAEAKEKAAQAEIEKAKAAAAAAADEKAKAEAEAAAKKAEEDKAKAEAEAKAAEEAAAAAKVEAEAAKEAADAAKEAEAEKKEQVQEAPKDDAEAKALAAKAEAEAKAAAEAKAKAEAEAKAKAAAEKAQAEAAKRAEAEAKAEAAAAEKAKAQEAKLKAEAEKLAAEAKKAEAEAAKAKADADRKKAEEAAAAAKAKADEAKAKMDAEAQARAAAEKAAAESKAKAEALQAELDRIAAEKAKAEEEARIAEEKRQEALARRKAAKAKKRYVKKASRLSRVFVKTKSRKVRIYVDGRFRGTTPMKGISIKAGKHTIEGRLGNKKTKRKVTIKGGKVQHVKLSI